MSNSPPTDTKEDKNKEKDKSSKSIPKKPCEELAELEVNKYRHLMEGNY